MPKTKKVSKRVLEMWKDHETVWGKNKPLEQFWQRLANGNVILLYKNGKHQYVTMPKRHTKKNKTLYHEFDNNTEIKSVLTSNPSQDAYEVYLYPKAKNKSVDYVIKNYKKYFDYFSNDSNMKKVMIPS